MTTHEYITKNWINTIRKPNLERDGVFIKMPKPYTVPCPKTLFINFFYWDTYFTNLGLLEDGLIDQVKNNLEVMANFIRVLGYVPNADHLLTRTQPPLFTRAMYDYIEKTNDVDFLKNNIEFVLKELRFFELDRNTKCGLNAYGNGETKRGKEWYYDEFNRRLKYTEEEKALDKDSFTDDLLVIAESGWDFNPRFKTLGNRFNSTSFAHLDLNCILYDVENKVSEFYLRLNDKINSDIFKDKAKKRKELIDLLMKDKETGIYYDYNFKENKLSNILSCVSFYPYAMGISDDKQSLIQVYNRLILEHGLSTCEYRGDKEKYFQWDYPSMWPSNVYFAYIALKKVGVDNLADELKSKYISVVDGVFEQTGSLWEKYDAKLGNVSVTSEYKTPDMMGWTAGVYEYLLKN